MAAGLGTRLRPLTLETPKPMLDLAGRPILERTIEILPPDVDDVILIVGYLKEKIMAHFGGEWRGRRIRYVEQRELKGTGDAVHRAAELLTGKFLVVNGDDLYDAADLAALAGNELAMLALRTDVARISGAIRMDERGGLAEIIEGASLSPGELINTGAYALDRRFFEYPLVPIKDGAEFGLPQTIARMAKDHPVRIVEAKFWMPVGTPEELRQAQRLYERA